VWKYEQESGAMIRPDGRVLEVGYSGRVPDGRNDPDQQCVKDVGPIPRGYYSIEPPRSKASKPFYMPLTPSPETDTCGRSAFQIHGDNRTHTASTGCIVLSRASREVIWNSDDHVLRVVRNSSDVTPAKLSKAPSFGFRGR
jgi:type VI secretion system (T6SS) effector TldE1-like protein